MKDLNKEYRPRTYVRKRVNVGYHITKWFVFGMFAIYAFTLLYPFVWMIMNSLKEVDFYNAGNKYLIPNGGNIITLFKNLTKYFDIRNYIRVLGEAENDETIAMMFLMSVVTTVLGTVINVGLSACVAYVIAKFKFPFRGVIYGIAIFTMVVPIVGTLPAQVNMMQNILHLDQTLLGVLFLYSGCFGFNFILLYSAFSSISDSYIEAAQVDGAGRFKTFFQVMLPMAKGPLIAASILTAIGYWNDYQTPRLYLPREYWTLAVGLEIFRNSNDTKEPLVFAAMIIAIIPILVLYLIFQKRIIESTNAGGLKG